MRRRWRDSHSPAGGLGGRWSACGCGLPAMCASIVCMSQRVTSPVMVGRDEELGRLLAVLEVAGRGTGACALVVAGEAGVGKTRLVEEFAGRARRDGALV